ncbi:hypothetical protein B296_00059130 [Ensete ventricosum]|uniref:Uncharacterized protein n=1 Tax=Ensete ventricosum TaxID=4639 RepID=A0A426XIX1_ENSVE|nr:hypothetical protein B296_00059130 [Ensete ventricosum]
MGRWRTSLLPPPQGAYRIVCGAISDEIAAVIVAQLLFQEFQNPSKTINSPIGAARRRDEEEHDRCAGDGGRKDVHRRDAYEGVREAADRGRKEDDDHFCGSNSQVNLVNQQYEVIQDYTELDVVEYCGAQGISEWNTDCWEKNVKTGDVIL